MANSDHKWIPIVGIQHDVFEQGDSTLAKFDITLF